MSNLESAHSSPSTVSAKLAAMPWSLVFVTLLIAGAGVVALYSVAGGSFTPWADRHAMRFGACLILVIGMAMVPIRFWLAIANPLYIVALILLILVPLVGISSMGARRWLGTAGLSIQPSELMKIALILALARLFHTLAPERRSRALALIAALVLIIPPTILVVRQPDLGSGVLLAAAGFAVLFLAGVRALYFVAGAVSVAGLAELIWLRLHDYQRNRLLTFLNPDRDPLGAGYHISQSKIALGSGGVSGKGLMMGSQSQLNFLPEKHTDFVYTMFAEETGFVGSLALIGLFGLLLGLLLVMAMRVRHDFGRLLIGGVAAMIAVHVTVNMAMVIGLLPVVGVPLPLVSFGGSAMLTMMVGIGLASSAYVHRNEPIRRDDCGLFI